MFKIGENILIGIDYVYNTDIKINDKVCSNLNLTKGRYKEIEGMILNSIDTSEVTIYHDKIGRMSFYRKSGVIAKDINKGDIYFVSNDILKNKDICNNIDDMLFSVGNSLKREFYNDL